MSTPEADKCNGIILGYVVYFSELSRDGMVFQEFNQSVPRNDDMYGFTNTTITGLNAFTWYQIDVVAYTSFGKGNKTNSSVFVQTFEDGKQSLII